MAARGVGMPCGIIARFQETNSDHLEAAIEEAKQRFPILGRRVSWINFRPMLVRARRADQPIKGPMIRSLFDSDCTFWRYRLLQNGTDTWLTAIWPHAMADGPSMLRFLETIAAIIANRPLFDFRYRGRRQVKHQPMAGWTIRFLIDQSRRYLRPSAQQFPPSVAWCALQREHSLRLIESSHRQPASAAAWLGAAACIALCEQKRVAKGRVLLNIQVQRSSLEHIGGFGFAAGSLLIPIKVNLNCSLPTLALSIFDRLASMINRGWNDNFEWFLGSSPQRHHWLAARHAAGRPAPIVSVSWKDHRRELGGNDKIRDVACFALSPTLHISGHLDRMGISLSITSTQTENERLYLLRRLVNRLSGETPDRILTFNGCDIASVPSETSSGRSIMCRSPLHARAISDALNRA
jgi:hypothetical protein